MTKTMDLLEGVEPRPLSKRGLGQAVCRQYGYGIASFNGEAVQVAPYHDDKGRVVAQKIRGKDKKFFIAGDMSKAELFGQRQCRRGGKMLVITEGEIDAMSCCEAMGLSWPAVSIPTGSNGAKGALQAQLDFLETYERVILAFDDDEPGRKATQECIQLFSPGKVAIATFDGYKDPNELLKARGEKALRNALWSAQDWRPGGIINFADKSIRDRVSAPLVMGIPYPWAGLNHMLCGFRPGDLVTWTAGTGIGKTAIVSEVVHHLLTTTEEKVGVIYLEEGIERSGRRFVGLSMNKPIHLPGVEYTDEEFDEAYEKTLGTGRLIGYDHFGSLDEDVLLNWIRYMVKAESCSTIILDHISLVVSGSDIDADERKMLDRITTKLKMMAVETNATVHMICHLRRAGNDKGHEEGGQVSLSHLRGTQAISQLSDAVIAGERNQQDDDAASRNRTIIRVLKNRYAGITGKACELMYDPETGRLADEWDREPSNDEDY